MSTWLLLSTIAITLMQTPATPQAAVDELVAADRAFAAAAATRNVVDALSAMFGDTVMMLAPPPASFARGKAQAADVLRTNPDNVKGRAEWAPIRGGISADGQHGFTVGYMTVHRPDDTRVPWKYVAYWTKQRDGWRVAVYKRSRAGEGVAPRTMMPPALPPRIVATTVDAAGIATLEASLDAAERAFSDDAQKIGLGPAFARHGHPDAVNVGPPTDPGFVVGAEAIGRSIGAGAPGPGSPVAWAPDDVIVASSGDLGVTMGMIRFNQPRPAGQPSAVPFITIWRRASPSDPWRYVAE
jgi:ketosteroid isomerase-like protein